MNFELYFTLFMISLHFESCPLSSQIFTIERCFDFLGGNLLFLEFLYPNTLQDFKEAARIMRFWGFLLCKEICINKESVCFHYSCSTSSSLQFFLNNSASDAREALGMRSRVQFLSFSRSLQQNLSLTTKYQSYPILRTNI